MERMSWGRKLLLLACAVVSTAPAISSAQEDPWFGAKLGVFYPTNDVLRDAMGDGWVSIGMSRVGTAYYEGSRMVTDWNILTQDRYGNKIFFVTPSIGVVMPLTDKFSSFQPYLAARVGFTYMDYAVTHPNTHVRLSGKEFGYNLNAEVGVNIFERVVLSARYDLFDAKDGLDFDGLTISLRWGLLRF